MDCLILLQSRLFAGYRTSRMHFYHLHFNDNERK